MRFSHLIAMSTFALAAAPSAAQEDPPAETPGPPAAKAFEHDKGCVREPDDRFESFLGEPVAWPEEGQTVHTPAGLTVLDRPVSYVLVKRDEPGGPITEIGYRLQGMQRKVGQPHDSGLLEAFDETFNAAKCAGSTLSTCGVNYRPNGTPFSGAMIGSGELDVARNARGPSLALVKADYDLQDADPVFLVCYYRGG